MRVHRLKVHCGLPEPCLSSRTPGDPPCRGENPPKIPLSLSKGFYWDGEAVFPDPPKDGMYPSKDTPVTKTNIESYTMNMLNNMFERAALFRTPHVLWPWVRCGPRALVLQLCTGTAVMGPTLL